MAQKRMFSHQKWHGVGKINIILTSGCAVVLLICLVISISQPSSSLYTSTILFDGHCDQASRLDAMLHLFINIIATAVLASSNFFMQILSSPSRLEVDKAHANLQSLDIGIPSIKNIQFLSPFKLACWLGLFITSIPIHLFFNSTIFETGYLGGKWNLTIATEAFTQGRTFYPPGASLARSGFSGPEYAGDIAFINDEDGYGSSDDPSNVFRYLNITARDSGGWERLDKDTCLTEYRSCGPRTKYRDVVIIVETGTEDHSGWTRSQTFDFKADSNLSAMWDPVVPPNELNPLWYSTQCSVSRSAGLSKCSSDCEAALGNRYDKEGVYVPIESNSTIAFRDLQDHSFVSDTNFAYNYRYNEELNNLRVRSCRAQPVEYTCKVGLSNILLLTVVFCVVIKVTYCTLVVLKLPHTSLITPGDALASFISEPDMRTIGICTLDYVDSQRLEYGPRRPLDMATPGIAFTLTPRRWGSKTHRFISIIPRVVWSRTYLLCFPPVGLLVACVALSYVGNDNSL